MIIKIEALKKRIVHRFDVLLYRLCVRSVNRIFESNRGYAYLTFLNFSKWLQENPPSTEEMERAIKIYRGMIGSTDDEIKIPEPPQILWHRECDKRKI